MDGLWMKRCPRCGTYMTKIDPQATCLCGCCGWDESVPSFFCTLINRYCTAMTKQDADKLLAETGYYRT